MISVTALRPDDRFAWEELFCGYNAFYGRSWQTKADNHTARRLYDQVAENRGFIQYVLPL